MDWFKEKLPENLKSELDPSAGFLARGKEKFLAEFRARFGARQPVRSHRWLWRVAAAAAAVLVAMSAASVYADSRNVPSGHPLYGLKRLNEAWQDLVTGSDNQPDLHLKFATRRLSEVENLATNQPGAKEIDNLTEDLHQEMKASLMAASGTKKINKKEGFCRALNNFVSGGSPVIEKVMMSHPKMINRYENQCGGFLNNQ